jgi:nucleoside-diphosphate-sugar epimerase
LHVVLGGAGGVGASLVAELVQGGRQVRVVGRHVTSVPNAEAVVADVTVPAQVAAAVAGARVVFHAAQPPYHRWAPEFAALNATIVAACSGVGAKLVFVDNLYMYGPITGPIGERTPQQPESRKGRVRKSLADDLLKAHRDGQLPVVIGRLADYFGPGGVNSSLGEVLFDAIVAGKPARWLYNQEVPHSVHYLPDVARALVALGDSAAADGQVWHLPATADVTGRQFLQRAVTAAGSTSRAGVAGPFAMAMVGLFNSTVRELREIRYQYDRPFVIDAHQFAAQFPDAATVTDLDTALAATVAWFRQRHQAQRH